VRGFVDLIPKTTPKVPKVAAAAAAVERPKFSVGAAVDEIMG
jgi:hypothetical protein